MLACEISTIDGSVTPIHAGLDGIRSGRLTLTRARRGRYMAGHYMSGRSITARPQRFPTATGTVQRRGRRPLEALFVRLTSSTRTRSAGDFRRRALRDN